MKTLTIFNLLFVIIISSCAAQKKISSLDNNSITKATFEKYRIKKQQNNVIIENSKNILTTVKQSSPNLPANIRLRPYYVKLDVGELTKVFARNIPLIDLESLASIMNSGILIDLRANIEGKILEVSFFTDDNSILNLKQFEVIENNIKESNLIAINREVDKYLKGSNFLLVDTRLIFSDILKMKKSL